MPEVSGSTHANRTLRDCLLSVLGLVLIQLSRVNLEGDDRTSNLYGGSIWSSVGVWLVVAPLLAMMLRWLHHKRIPKLLRIFFLVWALVSLHYLHISSNNAYTNDLAGHIDRAQYIADHLSEPYGYSSWQQHHPPAYYYIAAAGIHFSKAVDTIPFKTVLRFLSWLWYAVFILYGLRTLATSRFSQTGLHLGAALFALWPAGFHAATKISPEPMYYALFMIAFYHVLRWHSCAKQVHLYKAILWSALALTVRTNIVILLLLIGILVLLQVHKRQLSLTELLRQRRMQQSLLILAACSLIAFGNTIFKAYPLEWQFGFVVQGDMPFLPMRYLYLDYLSTIAYPFNSWSTDQTFWGYLIKTSLYGEYITWPASPAAAWIIFFVMNILFFVFAACLFIPSTRWREMSPHFLHIGISLFFLIAYFAQGRMLVFQDARFIFPALISFTFLFMKGYDVFKERNWNLLTLWAQVLVASLCVLSVYYFWNNFR